MTNDRTSRNRAAGFTLIEVMLALAVIGVVVTVSVSSLWLAQRAWQGGESQAVRTGDLQLTARILRESVGQIVLGQDDFIGSEQELSFTAVMPPYPTLGGTYRMAFRVENQDGVRQLVMRRMLTNINTQSPYWDGTQAQSTLITWAGDIQFAFLDEEIEDDQIIRTWVTEWRSRRPPPLMALRLLPADGSTDAPVEILAAPHATLPTDCLMNTVSEFSQSLIREDCL